MCFLCSLAGQCLAKKDLYWYWRSSTEDCCWSRWLNLSSFLLPQIDVRKPPWCHRCTQGRHDSTSLSHPACSKCQKNSVSNYLEQTFRRGIFSDKPVLQLCQCSGRCQSTLKLLFALNLDHQHVFVNLSAPANRPVLSKLSQTHNCVNIIIDIGFKWRVWLVFEILYD